MHKALFTFALTVLLTQLAVAGPETIIRERAKQLRDQNNARQGVPPPTPPAQRPAQPTPSTAPTPTPTVAAAPPGAARLQSNLAAIKTNSVVSSEQKQQITRDLTAMAQGSAKPSSSTLGRLAANLAVAFAEKPIPAADRSRIIQDLNAVLNPSNLPASQMAEIVADVPAVLGKKGVSKDTAEAVGADLKAVAAEVQKAAK